MKLIHIVTEINNGAQTQHRLLLGKHAIAEGLERTRSEAEIHLDRCFELYVETVRAQDAARKQKEVEAQKSQGLLKGVL